MNQVKYFNHLKNIINFKARPTTEFFLSIVATIIILLMFLKSILDTDESGDTWMYHLPFAARLWGIVTAKEYIFEYDTEYRFQGFPVLGEFLQGFFWFIFGSPEAANLVSFLSLIIYIVFLRYYLQVPLYLSTISLLAVPLIHIAATACYVDLPGSICVSMMIILTYLLYTRKDFLTRRNALIFIIAAAGAANTKHQLVPVVFLILCFALYKVVKLHGRQLLTLSVATILAVLLIFATQVKNTFVHGNPFYPVKVQVAGVVLNHTEDPPNFMSANLKKLSPTQRWAKSLLEIGAFDKRRPQPWTIAMDFIPWESESFGIGGYLAAYVVFNLLLLSYLCWKNWGTETQVALILVLIMSIVTSILPQSYELRYYLYWMISLISLNLYLVSQTEKLPARLRIINSQNVGLIATSVTLIFIILTKGTYTYPHFHPFQSFSLKNIVKEKVMKQINDNDNVCIVGLTPYTFLYNSKFHPPRKYLVKAEFKISPEYSLDKCKLRKVIVVND